MTSSEAYDEKAIYCSRNHAIDRRLSRIFKREKDMKVSELAYRKAWRAGKRLPELEYIIMTDPQIACFYAEDIIKGRWIEAEDIIMNDPHETYCYAIQVIKGKLPEKIHNMMLLHAIKDPDNCYVKEYFEFIK